MILTLLKKNLCKCNILINSGEQRGFIKESKVWFFLFTDKVKIIILKVLNSLLFIFSIYIMIFFHIKDSSIVLNL